jgi:enterochelin esterase-like enzyme
MLGAGNRHGVVMFGKAIMAILYTGLFIATSCNSRSSHGQYTRSSQNTYSTEQLQVQDYWDRMIKTETTVKSVITFYRYTPSSNQTMAPRF